MLPANITKRFLKSTSSKSCSYLCILHIRLLVAKLLQWTLEEALVFHVIQQFLVSSHPEFGAAVLPIGVWAVVGELAVVALDDAVVTLEDAVVTLEDAVVALVGVTVTLESGTVALEGDTVTLVGETVEAMKK